MYPKWHMPFRYIVFVACLALVIGLFYLLRQAIQPFVIAGFTAYLINPIVKWLRNKSRLSHGWAVNLVYFGTLLLFIGIPALVTPIVFKESQMIARDLLNLVTQINQFLAKPITIGPYILYFTEVSGWLSDIQTIFLNPLPNELFHMVETTSIGVLWTLVILVTIHLLLSYWPRIKEYLLNLPPDPYKPEALNLYLKIQNIWMAYLRGQILLMAIVTVVFTLAWYIIGIPGALALGLIAGFLTLIPDVGPFIAAVLAIGVALLEGSSWIQLDSLWIGLITLITYLVLINIKNFFVRPVVMGKSVNMNEGLVFVAIITATILWGILGALLIVPVLASFVIIWEFIRRRVSGLSPIWINSGMPFVNDPDDQALPDQVTLPDDQLENQTPEVP